MNANRLSKLFACQKLIVNISTAYDLSEYSACPSHATHVQRINCYSSKFLCIFLNYLFVVERFQLEGEPLQTHLLVCYVLCPRYLKLVEQRYEDYTLNHTS